MGGFDTLALGSKILFGDNWFSDFNAALHESSIYNITQTTIASVAVFSGGMNSGFNKAANSAGVKPSCFVAGTLVMAVAGMVAIEKIKSGDKVISTYPETMETSPKTVLETYIREVTTLVHLTVNGEEIITTIDHPFYVKNQGFIKAGELIVGDELLDVNGNILLVENFDVELTDKPVKVYNFQVEDFHTYYVGGFRILVHNAGDAYKRPSGYRKGVRDKTWEEAKANSPDGIVRDPKTGKPINPNEPWDMGHKPGYEFRKHRASAQERGIDRKQFLDEHNDSSHYRPELPSSNRSHSCEDMTDQYLGP